MNESTEKKLNNYRGFVIYKITDNKGTSKQIITYEASTEDGDLFDCNASLTELKKLIDNYFEN